MSRRCHQGTCFSFGEGGGRLGGGVSGRCIAFGINFHRSSSMSWLAISRRTSFASISISRKGREGLLLCCLESVIESHCAPTLGRGDCGTQATCDAPACGAQRHGQKTRLGAYGVGYKVSSRPLRYTLWGFDGLKDCRVLFSTAAFK